MGPIWHVFPLAQLISSTRSAYNGGEYNNLLRAKIRHAYFRSASPRLGPTKLTWPSSLICKTREALNGAANKQPFGARTSVEYFARVVPRSGPTSMARPPRVGSIIRTLREWYGAAYRRFFSGLYAMAHHLGRCLTSTSGVPVHIILTSAGWANGSASSSSSSSASSACCSASSALGGGGTSLTIQRPSGGAGSRPFCQHHASDCFAPSSLPRHHLRFRRQ
mmetsp:Transcript_26235/g.79051  ORF Transcript_26235/g.79051 Transcript_26235/m.79051 type:complete len:221 (+) Transcript_26235:272-934(+)